MDPITKVRTAYITELETARVVVMSSLRLNPQKPFILAPLTTALDGIKSGRITPYQAVRCAIAQLVTFHPNCRSSANDQAVRTLIERLTTLANSHF